jgi:hypothetical protein
MNTSDIRSENPDVGLVNFRAGRREKGKEFHGWAWGQFQESLGSIPPSRRNNVCHCSS